MRKQKYIVAKIIAISLFLFVICCCSLYNDTTQEVFSSFCKETGIKATLEQDRQLIRKAKRWQGRGNYPGVDKWTTIKIGNATHLLGGLPGQSQFYTIRQTLVSSDTIKNKYWKSLQVKPNDTLGYRSMVATYQFQDSLVVALSKVTSNPAYGKGGAWQLYVEDFKNLLIPMDTINLYISKNDRN